MLVHHMCGSCFGANDRYVVCRCQKQRSNKKEKKKEEESALKRRVHVEIKLRNEKKERE